MSYHSNLDLEIQEFKARLTVKTLVKYDWIMKTINGYHAYGFPLDEYIIQSVFNIPLTDAKIIYYSFCEPTDDGPMPTAIRESM